MTGLPDTEILQYPVEEVCDDDLAHVISFHLSANHYPPVPQSFVETCITAIKLGRQGLWNNAVQLPHGASRRGRRYVPAIELIQHLHLDHWI